SPATSLRDRRFSLAALPRSAAIASTSRVKIRTCRQFSTSLSRIRRSTRSRNRSRVPSTSPAIPSTRFRALAIASSKPCASDSNVSAEGAPGEPMEGLSSLPDYLVSFGRPRESRWQSQFARPVHVLEDPQSLKSAEPLRTTPMQLRILEKQKDSVRIEILNPDDTVIYPLITALLKDPDVEDALYYTGHP